MFSEKNTNTYLEILTDFTIISSENWSTETVNLIEDVEADSVALTWVT